MIKARDAWENKSEKTTIDEDNQSGSDYYEFDNREELLELLKRYAYIKG